MISLTFQTAQAIAKLVPDNAIAFLDCRVSNDLSGYIQIQIIKDIGWWSKQFLVFNPFLVCLLGYLESPAPEEKLNELRLRFAGSLHRGSWYRPSLDLLEYIKNETIRPSVAIDGTTHPAIQKPTDRMVSIEELAAYLKTSVPTIRRWVKAGMIPASRYGDRILRFNLPDVLKALERK